jgi:hypothetical protein
MYIREGIFAEDESEQPVDDGLENEIAESVYDSGKRAADDNTDGHIKHVSARDELLKLIKKTFYFLFHIQAPLYIALLRNALLFILSLRIDFCQVKQVNSQTKTFGKF